MASTYGYSKALAHKIRYALEPDNPGLIKHWLEVAGSRRLAGQPLAVQYWHYERQVRLLLDTIADESLPFAWRCTCLDYIYKPMLALRCLARTSDHQRCVSRLQFEVNQICRYAMAGFCIG